MCAALVFVMAAVGQRVPSSHLHFVYIQVLGLILISSFVNLVILVLIRKIYCHYHHSLDLLIIKSPSLPLPFLQPPLLSLSYYLLSFLCFTRRRG